jgi:hypothetical protein
MSNGELEHLTVPAVIDPVICSWDGLVLGAESHVMKARVADRYDQAEVVTLDRISRSVVKYQLQNTSDLARLDGGRREKQTTQEDQADRPKIRESITSIIPTSATFGSQHRLDKFAVAWLRGIAYDQLREHPRIYALPVINSDIRSGQIFIWRCEKNVAVYPTADERRILHTTVSDRNELALKTITLTLDCFRTKALLKYRWSVTGDARAHTFFISCCKLQFYVMFHRWSREHADRLAPIRYSLSDEVITNQLMIDLTVSLEHSTIAIDTLVGIMAENSLEAEQLGITSRAVEDPMNKFQQRVRKTAEHGEIEVSALLADTHRTSRVAA